MSISSLSGPPAQLATGDHITPLMTTSLLMSPNVTLPNFEESTHNHEVGALDTHYASSGYSGSLDSAEIHPSFHIQTTAGPGSMVASRGIAKADHQQDSQPVAGLTYDIHGVTSATADTTLVAEAHHVIDSPLHQASIDTVRRRSRLPRIRKKRCAKPPQIEVSSHEAGADSSDDEYAPVAKRRKSAYSTPIRSRDKPNSKPGEALDLAHTGKSRIIAAVGRLSPTLGKLMILSSQATRSGRFPMQASSVSRTTARGPYSLSFLGESYVKPMQLRLYQPTINFCQVKPRIRKPIPRGGRLGTMWKAA